MSQSLSRVARMKKNKAVKEIKKKKDENWEKGVIKTLLIVFTIIVGCGYLYGFIINHLV